MTLPRESSDDDNWRSLKIQHRELLHSFAEKYDNTYVLDLFEYAPEYDEKFKENFYLRGHMNPQGYLLTAKMTAAYIDYICLLYTSSAAVKALLRRARIQE